MFPGTFPGIEQGLGLALASPDTCIGQYPSLSGILRLFLAPCKLPCLGWAEVWQCCAALVSQPHAKAARQEGRTGALLICND